MLFLHFLQVTILQIGKNPESSIWCFEMNEWKRGSIPQNKSKTGKWYLIEKKSMSEMPIKDFRGLMEKHWKEFDV